VPGCHLLCSRQGRRLHKGPMLTDFLALVSTIMASGCSSLQYGQNHPLGLSRQRSSQWTKGDGLAMRVTIRPAEIRPGQSFRVYVFLRNDTYEPLAIPNRPANLFGFAFPRFSDAKDAPLQVKGADYVTPRPASRWLFQVLDPGDVCADSCVFDLTAAPSTKTEGMSHLVLHERHGSSFFIEPGTNFLSFLCRMEDSGHWVMIPRRRGKPRPLADVIGVQPWIGSVESVRTPFVVLRDNIDGQGR